MTKEKKNSAANGLVNKYIEIIELTDTKSRLKKYYKKKLFQKNYTQKMRKI